MSEDPQRSTGVPPVPSQPHGRDARAPLRSAIQRSTGILPVQHGRDARVPFFDPRADVDIRERNLPHWNQGGVWTFVTWHLGDSLPAARLRSWRAEKEIWLRLHPKPWGEETTIEFHERFTERIEAWLDAGEGSCLLRYPDIRRVLTDALLHFDGARYVLGDLVAMPNHVHVLFRPADRHLPSGIIHSWKSFSAKRINDLTSRSGSLWSDEYWDRLIRSERHLGRCRGYMAQNPIKARLSSDSFTYRSTGGTPVLL